MIDLANKVSPRLGRVLMLQLAQVFFALAAGLFLLLHGNNPGVFMAMLFVMFFFQGINPSINRPIVYSVVPPALRGAAFAVMISITM